MTVDERMEIKFSRYIYIYIYIQERVGGQVEADELVQVVVGSQMHFLVPGFSQCRKPRPSSQRRWPRQGLVTHSSCSGIVTCPRCVEAMHRTCMSLRRKAQRSGR